MSNNLKEIYFYDHNRERNAFRQGSFEPLPFSVTEERSNRNNSQLLALASSLEYVGIDNFYQADFPALNQLSALRQLDLEIRDGDAAFGVHNTLPIDIPTLKVLNLIWQSQQFQSNIRISAAEFAKLSVRTANTQISPLARLQLSHPARLTHLSLNAGWRLAQIKAFTNLQQFEYRLPAAPINDQLQLVSTFLRLKKVLLYYVDANTRDDEETLHRYERNFDQKLRQIFEAKRTNVRLYFEYLSFENSDQLRELTALRTASLVLDGQIRIFDRLDDLVAARFNFDYLHAVRALEQQAAAAAAARRPAAAAAAEQQMPIAFPDGFHAKFRGITMVMVIGQIPDLALFSKFLTNCAILKSIHFIACNLEQDFYDRLPRLKPALTRLIIEIPEAQVQQPNFDFITNLLNLAEFQTNGKLTHENVLQLSNLRFIEKFTFKARFLRENRKRSILAEASIESIAQGRHTKVFSLQINRRLFRQATLAEQLQRLQRRVAIEEVDDE